MTLKKSNLPLLISIGDPNGVGPEICLKGLLKSDASYRSNFILVADLKVLNYANDKLGLGAEFILAEDLEKQELTQNQIQYSDLGVNFEGEVSAGQVDELSGEASILWVKQSVISIQNEKAAALITAPICKESIEKRIPGFQGHTEYIGEMCGDPEPVLALIHNKWTVAHVSTHVSLKEACERVQPERIKKTARLLNELCSKLNPEESIKLGMAGLNPHAGENGMFGREEIEIINPTSKALRDEGIEITDALPADVVFPMLKGEHFHGVVAMYHDQGHVVTKTLAFDLGKERKLNGVNITLGVNVLRTSVDHGTGFDVAYQNVAAPDSLLDAMNVAFKMVTK